ncbi:MAG: Maf family protein [Planctomycetota bacterium]|nr:Maf family protein [Planctomycetota bacterium]MDA1161848.1 Maf family protein [Planctomycetota bacterium]
MALSVVVGSRSPRRLELLSTIVDPERLVVLPPRDANEPGFEDLSVLSEFHSRILEIVAVKQTDVVLQLQNADFRGTFGTGCVVICADTTVIVTDRSGRPLALGQPSDGDDWQNDVRLWFREYFAGKTHSVLSGVSATLLDAAGQVRQTATRTCSTRVTMRDDVESLLDWYISTGEPIGKAGGYAIQGAGSAFITKFEGSFSNVVGLPLEETMELLRELTVLD